VLILLYGSGAWIALGWLIVAPTVITMALMVWGYIIWKIIEAFGGDPREDYVGIVIFLSFVFLVSLAVTYLSSHR
jgi:hypothetical protein